MMTLTFAERTLVQASAIAALNLPNIPTTNRQILLTAWVELMGTDAAFMADVLTVAVRLESYLSDRVSASHINPTQLAAVARVTEPVATLALRLNGWTHRPSLEHHHEIPADVFCGAANLAPPKESCLK